MAKITALNRYMSWADVDHGSGFIQAQDEVLIVPLDEANQVVFTLEPAPAFGETALILPGGLIHSDESPAEAARRELREEVGCNCRQLMFFATLRPFSKYLSVTSHIHLAKELFSSPLDGDEAYPIQIRRFPLDKFDDLIASGQLLDARVIAALYMARAAGRKPSFA